MPVYSYSAIDTDGRARNGTVQAESVKTARTQLRTQSLIPLAVAALDAVPADGHDGTGTQAGASGRNVFARRIFSTSALAIWTRQLAGLVSSGLPLERALGSLSDDADALPQRNINASLRASVSGGATFASALEQHPREFAAIFVAVIGAGEHSGKLGLVLERLADDLEDRQTLQAKLIGAALYPFIVSVVACCIVLFLMGYVVPQVASVFAGGKHALPILTVAMMAISDFLRQWGWLAFLLILLAFVTLWALLKHPAFREEFDARWLKLPVLGKLSRGYNAARYASTLAILSAAGVPILKALQAAAGTLSNHALRRDALDALVLVREGAPLASALAQKKRFPGLLAMFARLGEQTGQLPQMLDRAARQLNSEVQRRAMALATLLEPLLIVAMGLVVMLIVLAVLMPIIELNQWVK
jgi:general secretion pathway protein F